MAIILVVDDSPTILRTLSFMIRRMGHMVITARNGNDALRQLEAQPADMIITDLDMPEMDGLALLKILRTTPKYENTPIVMLTGSGDNAYEQQAVDKKVNGFLTKPVSSQQLMGKINSFIF